MLMDNVHRQETPELSSMVHVTLPVLTGNVTVSKVTPPESSADMGMFKKEKATSKSFD